MSLQNISANDLREKFLSFFEQKGHKRLPSSSLLPENDPSVLFTTAGMQQFKRFYLFPDEAPASRITTCQKCVRTGDIDEVGDETHLTFFEMLGNFSFGYEAGQSEKGKGESKSGPYFKKEAIQMAWEFLTVQLGINKSRIYATYFSGENSVAADEDSLTILKTIDGLTDIRKQGFEDNFWSLGTEGSPGGPTVEFYVDGVEVWNLVFNEFVLKDGKYEPSELKGIDTGMGFERLVAILQNKSDIYQTDLFLPIIKKIEELSGLEYILSICHSGLDPESIKIPKRVWDDSNRDIRIIADHIRSAVFMISDGVEPSNKGQGYILRRLIRRAVVKGKKLGIDGNFTSEIFDSVCHSGLDPESIKILNQVQDDIAKKLDTEELKFRNTLENGLRQFEIISGMKTKSNEEDWDSREIDADELFDLYQTYGLPVEISLEISKEKNIPIKEGAIGQFEAMKRIHQELSRTASAGMFRGGLADNKVETTKLHTAAHLLLAALRHELGEGVEQKGSNITEERLRFDFNYPEKLSNEQIEKIENLVNLKITEALPVTMQEMNIEEAKSSGAAGSFHDKYGDSVKIFTVGSMEEPFSREICGGPHVENTSELGHFEITKEESSSSGVRRIKAALE